MLDVKAIEEYVEENLKGLGINKKREVVRLLFEVSKREKCDFTDIIAEATKESDKFQDIKEYLYQRRFPGTTKLERSSHILTKLDIDPSNRVNIESELAVSPYKFIIEEAVEQTALVERLKKLFPAADFAICASYKGHINNKCFGINDYNERTKTFYVIRENFNFFKPCPCSPNTVSCGYHNVNLGSGCAFECTYCCLQDYINSPGIVIPANIEDFFDRFKEYKQNIRVGSGELTDSLIFDHITEFSPLIVDFFKNYPKSIFEFKTKSDNIDNLLKIKSAENIVIGWSLNPQKVIDTDEFYTASLDKRFEAALSCVDAGYRVAFHFDPIIYYEGWDNDYVDIVDRIFENIDAKRIAWISLGTLRMRKGLKSVIENRFIDNTILDGELLVGYDGKIRYNFNRRLEIYKKMKERIYKYSKDIFLYLCMEEKDMYKACGF